MKQFWMKILSGAAAIACASAAHAYVIDFENIDTSGAPFAPLISDGDYILQGDYGVQVQDANNGGPHNGSLVGQLVNGSDPGTCLDGSCPDGNSSNYLAALNNGLLYIIGLDTITLSSFDAAFLPPSGVALPSGTVARLAIEADRADGSYALGLFGLEGPDAATGVTSFASYAASDATIVAGSGTLTSGDVIDLYVFAYYCGASTSCSAFSSDKGQFAIDNIAVNVPAVPEPAEWILMALGLAVVSTMARRRRPI